MNNSDFISDAVALDLGKSGVKIAETLEIKLGSEWWRLVNSSGDTTTLKTYEGRATAVPIVVGGEINLASKRKDLGFVGLPSSPMSQEIMAWVGEELTPTIFSGKYAGTGVPHMTVTAEDGTFIDSKTATNNVNGNYGFLMFQDHVNDAVIFNIFYSPTGNSYPSTYNISTKTFTTLGQGLRYSAGATTPKVFREKPNTIYTLFRTAGSLVVKITNPTVGQNGIYVASSVFNVAGGTTIVAGSNYRGEEAELFYSRKEECAGVAWVDKTNKCLYFVLESENWGTAHILSQATVEDGVTLTSFGNLILPKTAHDGGEFYVAGLRKQDNTVFKRPTGYSYPVGLTIISACSATATEFRVIGRVDGDIYIFSVAYDGMVITKASNASTFGHVLPQFFNGYLTSAYGSMDLIKLGSFGNKELLCIQGTGEICQCCGLICYDVTTGQIDWTWGGQGATHWSPTYFPNTSYYIWREQYRSQFIKRVGEKIRIAQTCTSNWYEYATVDYYALNISHILSCTTVEGFIALLTNLHAYCPIITSQWSAHFIPHFAHEAITWDETDDYYLITEAPGTLSLLYLNKETLMPISMQYMANRESISCYGSGITANKTMQEERTLRYNFTGTDMNLDTWIRSNYWGQIRFIDILGDIKAQVNLFAYTGNSYTGRQCLVATNKYGVGYNVIWTGSTCYFQSGHYSGSGSEQVRTFPFTILKGMVSEFEDKIVLYGDVTGGEIPCSKFNCSTLDTEKPLAINAEDFTDTYTISLNTVPVAGYRNIQFMGSSQLYQEGTGQTWVISTGASLEEGVGGYGEGGGDIPDPIVYSYRHSTYVPYPFLREGIKVELTNISKTTKITLPETQTDLIRGMLTSGVEFRGSQCIVRRIFPDHASDEGSDMILIDGYIQDWSYSPDKKGILFTVSKTLIDVGATFPKRLMGMGCSHVFKGKRCGYLGADDICIKTKTDCTAKGRVSQFGAFPWVAARQRRVMWK